MQGPGSETADSRDPEFRRRLALICAIGLGIRVLYVLLVTKGSPLYGDATYYSAQGQVIADGRGFAHPYFFAGTMPAADHPPLAALVFAIGPLIAGTKAMAFGLPLYIFLQRLTVVLIGTLTIAVVGAAGRRLQGSRVGLIAAGLAALHPSLWVNDGIVMSESIAALALAAVIWVALIAWDRSGWRWWAALGATIGIAALARAESVGLLIILGLPMVVWKHWPRIRDVIGAAAAMGVACLLVVSTWLIPNAIRFEERALFSTNDGLTWIGANCPDTYSGPAKGLWTPACLRFIDSNDNGINDLDDLNAWNAFEPATEDGSQISRRYQTAAFSYIRNNLHELPSVVAVRVLRTWGFYDPGAMAEYNRGEGRGLRVSWAAWAFHIALLPFCVLGFRALRRAGRPTWPFVANAVAVTAVSALIYGLARFRLGWDVAAVILAAAGIEAVLRSRADRQRPAGD